jgi:hypothetical protein
MKTYWIDCIDTEYRVVVGCYDFKFENDDEAREFCRENNGGGEMWYIDWERTHRWENGV